MLFSPEQWTLWALAVTATAVVRFYTFHHPPHVGLWANHSCTVCHNRRRLVRGTVLTVVVLLMLTEYVYAHTVHHSDLGFLALEFVNDDWF